MSITPRVAAWEIWTVLAAVGPDFRLVVGWGALVEGASESRPRSDDTMESYTERWVLVVGSSNMDLQVSTDRLPSPGETVLGSDTNYLVGGKGANQAIAVQRLGRESCSFVSVIGNDDFGNRIANKLGDEGVQCAMIRSEQRPTGTAFVCVEESSGENMIVVSSGANLDYDDSKTRDAITQVIASRANPPVVLLLQLEIPVDACNSLITLVREFNPSVRVVLNPAPIGPLLEPQHLGIELLNKTDVLIPNTEELRKLNELPTPRIEDQNTGNAPSTQLIDALERSYSLQIIATLGSEGAYAMGHHVGAIAVEKVVDTVGAGDCFCGAIAVQLAESVHEPRSSLDWMQLVRFANRAAALSVTRIGAQSSPFRNELDETS